MHLEDEDIRDFDAFADIMRENELQRIAWNSELAALQEMDEVEAVIRGSFAGA